MDKYNSIVYIHHISFIDSSIDGDLGWVHNLAIINHAAINIDVQASPCNID